MKFMKRRDNLSDRKIIVVGKESKNYSTSSDCEEQYKQHDDKNKYNLHVRRCILNVFPD